MKKLFSVLLVFVLICSVLPNTTFAASGYAQSVQNVAHTTRTSQLVISSSSESQQNEAEGWTWDKESKTLTLNNVNFDVINEISALRLNTSATIVLVGSNSIKSTYPDTKEAYVTAGLMLASGSWVFEGDGSLMVSGGESRGGSHGIYAYVTNYGSITINSGTITATGGFSKGSSAAGISAWNNRLIINGGTVIAVGGTAYNGNTTTLTGGISSSGIYMSSSDIIITGGTVTATSGIGGTERMAGAAIIGRITLESGVTISEPLNGKINTISNNTTYSVFDSSGEIARKVIIQGDSNMPGIPVIPAPEVSPAPLPQTTTLAFVSSTPAKGARDVVDDTLSLTFDADINHNLNWSAGTIQIRDYDTDQTVLTIDNKEFYSMGGYVSGATLTIPNALSSFTVGGHYYVMVDENLIWTAAANADGSVSTFAGFGDHEFHFVMCPPDPTEKKTLLFRGTSIDVDWNWDYFAGDACENSANRNLAIAALVLSAEDKSSDDTIDNLKTLGFTNNEPNYYEEDKINRPAIVIGSTNQTINGEDKTIIALVIRGSTTLADWITNAGAAFNAFSPSIDFAYTKLTEYINKHLDGLDPKDTILFITGHSLGGGVAGGLALRMDKLASRSNTFVYTFASTNYKVAGYNPSDYKNVINYINDSDLVPKLPIPTGPNSKVGRRIHYNYDYMNNAEKNSWQQAYSLITGKSFHLPLLVKQQHLVETYMAFLLCDLPYSSISSYFNVAGIHCPVDVKVYNNDGALMASVTNGKVSHSSDTEVMIYVDGDEKYVIMPTAAEYRIELTGTDTGTMQYVVQQVNADTWEAKTEKDFSEIPLYSGKQIVNEVGGNSDVAATRLFVLDEEGKISEEIPGVVQNSNSNRFTDVSPSAYYYDAVMWAYNAEPQVTNGMDATHFGPESTVTRGQAVTFLWRAVGCPEPTSTNNPFEDVKEGQYYTEAVLWAIEKGITNGTSQNTFSPNDTCTNAQILTFIWRCLGEPGKTGTGTWYEDSLNWATRESLLRDTGAATSVNGQCPRRDVVTFLYRAMA